MSSLATECGQNMQIGPRSTIEMMVGTNSRSWVSNCMAELTSVEIGSHLLPVTRTQYTEDNCYVCSPYASMVSYALYELQEVNHYTLRRILRSLIYCLAPLLRAADIDRVICVNNWMLSTNLYPNWKGEDLENLTKRLIAQNPDHAIILRSLNQYSNADLSNALWDADYLRVPSRQVYIYPTDGTQLQRANTKRDLHLLHENSEHRIVRHTELTDDDDERIKQLYDQLYLEKYTPLNPQFTINLIRTWRKTGQLKFFGLRNRKGVLDGIAGCFIVDKTWTTPIVGYDMKLPQSAGLYRMLMALIIEECKKREVTLNLSSGAAQFKRLRGGLPEIECSAVYCKHLSFSRRLTWKFVSELLSHIGERVLVKFKL